MSADENILANHPIINLIGALNKKLDSYSGKVEFEPYATHIEKLRAILTYLELRLLSADPILLPDGTLSAMVNQLTSAHTHLNNATSKFTKHLGNQVDSNINDALSYANQALVKSAEIPANVPAGVESTKDIIVSLRRTAAQHARNMEQEAEVIKVTLREQKDAADQILNDLNAQKGRIDKAISDFQAQFLHAEEARLQHFSNDIRTWSQEYSLEIEKAKEDLAGIKDFIKESFTTIEKDTSSKAESILSDLRNHKSEAEKLVGVIGNTGTASGFQETAVSSANSARVWEWLTIGSLVALVAAGVVIFVMTTKEGFDWHLLAARAIVVIPLGILAGYAAHKAEQLRAVERTSRRMALELASISPYLATMPSDKQNEIKQVLADRFFAQPHLLNSDGDKKTSTGTPVDVLKIALENLRAALEILGKK